MKIMHTFSTSIYASVASVSEVCSFEEQHQVAYCAVKRVTVLPPEPGFPAERRAYDAQGRIYTIKLADDYCARPRYVDPAGRVYSTTAPRFARDLFGRPLNAATPSGPSLAALVRLGIVSRTAVDERFS